MIILNLLPTLTEKALFKVREWNTAGKPRPLTASARPRSRLQIFPFLCFGMRAACAVHPPPFGSALSKNGWNFLVARKGVGGGVVFKLPEKKRSFDLKVR
jgi:hypothetical protein